MEAPQPDPLAGDALADCRALFRAWNIPRLIIYLNHHAGPRNWAFSGGFALYLWACWADTTARAPNDVDVDMTRAPWDTISYDLRFRNNVTTLSHYPPGPQAKAPIFECELGTGVKLDLHAHALVAHDIVWFGKLSDIPVLRLDVLRGRLALRAEEDWDPKSGQAQEDIRRLDAIAAAHQEKYRR
jgi:hypothetical protein